MCQKEVAAATEAIALKLEALPKFSLGLAKYLAADDKARAHLASELYGKRRMLGITKQLETAGQGSGMQKSLLREAVLLAAKRKLGSEETEAVSA